MTSPSADAAFAEFCLHGQPEALARVFDLTADRLLRAAMHLCRHAAQAEDLVQETFVTAIERASTFDVGRPVVPWLLGILTKRARLFHLRDQRRAPPERLATRRSGDPCEELQRRELALALDQAIDELPASLRAVMVLRVRHEMRAAEIAHALGVPPGTVRSQISRGMEWVRRALPRRLATGWLCPWSRERGLAAVRAAVLERWPAATGAPAMLVGGIAMQKLLFCCVGLLLVAGLAWSLAGAPPHPSGAPPTGVPRGAESRRTAPTIAALADEVPADVSGQERRAVADSDRQEPVPEPREASPCWITVRVRWQSGRDAEGAVVAAVALPEARGWPDEVSGRTGPTGAVRLALAAPGAYRLRTIRGRALDVDVARGQESHAELWIPRGFTITGSVVDPRGQPVGGAALWLTERWRQDKGAVIAHTDAAGAFEIRSVTGSRYIRAQHAHLAPSDLAPAAAATGQTAPVRLTLGEAGGRLLGRVLDDAGRPVARARLWVHAEPTATRRGLDGSWRPEPPPAVARTDAAGRFAFDGLAPGLLRLTARSPAMAPHQQDVGLESGATRHIDVHLAPGAVVHGAVIDAAGQPVPRARLFSGTGEHLIDRRTVADAAGLFALRGLPVGEVQVAALGSDNGPGYAPVTAELELAPGQVREWLPVMTRTAPPSRLTGRVIDHQDLPLANMRVVARSTAQGDDTDVAVTEPDGTFAMTEVPDGAVRITVSHRQPRGSFPVLIRDAVSSREPLLLQVPSAASSAGSLQVRILDVDGEPCSALVELWHNEKRIWRSLANDATTGQLRIDPLAAGTVSVQIRAENAPWRDLGSHEVVAGRNLDLGDIRLAAGGRVTGQIVGPHGPLATAVVRVLDADGEEAGAVRCRDGRFESGVLANGAYAVVAQGPGCGLAHQPLVVDGDTVLDVRLVAAPACRARFDLRGVEALPSWLGLVVRDRANRIVWFDEIDPRQGELSADFRLAPGQYTLRARAGGGWRGRHAFAVTRGAARADLQIALER
ncbi:MAG: sigma-70 family RNA polymerase sigma factor [Planctomycetota bacterium]